MRRRPTDWQLICRYLDKHDINAFENLMQRHYDTAYSYVLARSPQQTEASYLTQRVWTTTVDRLEEFEQSMSFPSFITDISNEVTTEFQRNRGNVPAPETHPPTERPPNTTEPPIEPTDSRSLAEERFNSEELSSMNCEERMIYLLKALSDHRDPVKLTWEALADFNGIDSQDAWDRFELVRKILIKKQHKDSGSKRLECEDLLIFLVWTQANRTNDSQTFSWNYFAELTGIPAIQLQLRYRSALRKTSRGLRNDDN